VDGVIPLDCITDDVFNSIVYHRLSQFARQTDKDAEISS